MDDNEEVYLGTPLQMTVECLRNPQEADAARVTVVLNAANKRIADLRDYITRDETEISDPLSSDISAAEYVQAGSAMEKIELQKLERAIPLLIDLRDEKQDAEDRAAKLAAREKASSEYENCLKKLHALAPQFEKAAATISAYSIANRNMLDAHRALDDEPPLVEISVDHAGISSDLAATLERAAKAMTDAANSRPERDAAAKAYRDETPERLKREQRARHAERAAFDADHRCIIDGLGKIAVPAAMAAARQTILDGGTFEQAARAGAEAAREFVEAAKAKQAA